MENPLIIGVMRVWTLSEKGSAVLAEPPEEVIACLVAGKQPSARST